MFHVSPLLVFPFFKLINTLVVLKDLQIFRPEFRAFHSIMRQISVTQTTDYDPGHGSIRDTHYSLSFQ